MRQLSAGQRRARAEIGSCEVVRAVIVPRGARGVCMGQGWFVGRDVEVVRGRDRESGDARRCYRVGWSVGNGHMELGRGRDR
eukprot:2996266-Rhodomonas_salina.1